MPPPSAQNLAIAVCSAVRVALSARPSTFVRLKSEAHSALSNAGGKGGRNCDPLIMENGVTNGQFGSRDGANAGGVGTQTPAPLPGV